MSEPTITREVGPTKGRYIARVDGIDAEAQLTYSRSGDKLIIADHTEVPDAFRGKGIGRLLAIRMVEDARNEGVKSSPYARSSMRSARSTPTGPTWR